MIELCEATEDNPFIHGMSKQFVAALQQLFDVMDTEQLGTICFADLANQWEEDDGDPFFPKGLIACLAKVKLPNGLLTFDRFCAGIKLCLLKNQVDINDVRMMTINDECRSMATSDSSITIPNGVDCNSSRSQLLQPPPAPALSTSVDRPSSEPQIFAPPPPSSLSSPTPTSSSNKTVEVNNNNISYSNNLKLTNNATCTQQMNSHHSQPVMTTEIPTAKKLPLPSYEQVMAAKSKPKVPPPPILIVNHHTNSDQSPTATTSTTTTNSELINIKRVVNHQYLESQYGQTGRNRPSINDDNQQQQTQPLQHQQACRAKSMPHLIDVSHNSQSSSLSFVTADQPNYHHQLPMNYQKHIYHNHSHTYQQHHATNENPKQQHNHHNSSANSLINDNNEQTPIIKTVITDGNSAPKTVPRNCIMKTLQNWRDNILSKHPLPSFNDLILQTKNTGADFHWPRSLVIKSAQTSTSNINRENNNMNQLQASPNNDDEKLNDQGFVAPVISITNDHNYIDNDQSMAMMSGFHNSSLHRRSSIRQQRLPREPRRHTVGANGIDLYAVKKFQQLEQEKDILIRGLEEIEHTKKWYLRQISSIQDRINIVGRSGGSSLIASDYNNIDAYQERINFQAVRIQTLNQHLTALRDAGQNFPIHMNLAIRPLNGLPSLLTSQAETQLSPQLIANGRMDPNQPRQLVVNPNLVNKLKEQNRLLTDEVTRKSERITQLEREKSSLIRELFQARTYSSYYNGHFDDTFM
ncbi:hypothetical protein HUG17_7106 [Dermatophagoides farinae]|uniref:Suppressor APC domain-containing protein n=1 Tax=Dermatophagoides farinae TaxID=6954 RepID=A0A9D4NNL5_DERFA|nr:hypothetical protein HUG17_7106 [Dermatophagoides farinae]